MISVRRFMEMLASWICICRPIRLLSGEVK